MLIASAIDRGFEPRSGQIMTAISMYFKLTLKYVELLKKKKKKRRKSEDLFAGSQDNVS